MIVRHLAAHTTFIRLGPGGKTVDGRSNLSNYSERALIGLSNALFRGAVALLVSELCVDLLKIVGI